MASRRANATRARSAASAEPASTAPAPRPSAAEVVNRLADAGRAVRAATSPLGLPTAAAPSTDLTSELNNIDFRKMIGGPLQAAVDAQVASALATVDFITRVGFTEDPVTHKKELVMVDLSHTRKEVNSSGTVVPKEVFIRVPLLAMLPIPSLRIDNVTIDFNVKLNSVESSTTSDELGINAEVGGKFGPVNFKVSASYQRKTATNVEVKKEYALNVNVKVVQDEIPAGLEKVLNLLAA